MSVLRGAARAVMKAIRVTEFGGPEVLKIEAKVPIPNPEDHQILVRVHASGINPVDTYIRSGTHNIRPALPFTPGMDSAGVVEKVGKAVTHFKPGDRVYSVRTVTGAYAEYAVVEEPYVAHLHKSLSFEQGAGIGVPYYTAYRSLILRANGKPGETVLIHGASGGVGIAACQIARALGFTVLGTAGTTEGIELVLKNGAHKAFNHREKGYLSKITDATNGQGPDIILEMLANVNLENDLNLIKTRGRIVNIGSRGTIQISPRFTMGKECVVTGVMLMTSSPTDWAQMHGALRAGMEQGWLKPYIGTSYPLEQASQSHTEIMKDSGHKGKIILKS
ncbi:zeta-crystallin-like isoform X2 [Liolophura sinensis]